MFRKKRSSSNLPNPQNATPSAASAAAQAFVKKQLDDGKLSAGAAAAALRSHTPTPAPISDLQTKRMVRRGSVSSVGSGTSNGRQPFGSSLQRRGSNGSMSSRTFRSPSPGGRNGTPPVPAIPSDIPPIPTKSHRRTPNEEPPQRVFSPPPQKNGRASSLDSSEWAPSNQQRSKLPSSGLARVPEQPTPMSPVGTPRNINFSRPMSPPLSPGSPNSPVNGMVWISKPRPASTMGLTAEQYRRLQQRQEAQALDNSGQATKTITSYNPASRSVETTVIPLSPSRPLSPPTSTSAPQTPQSQTPSSPISKKRPTVDTQVATNQQRQQPPPRNTSATGQRALSMNALPSPTAEEIKSFQTRAASLLARPLTDTASITSQPIPRPRSALLKASTPPSASAGSNKGLTPSNHNRSVSTPVSQNMPASEGVRRGDSVSPARSARFSDAPLLNVTRHEPPPRSVSPVKSAMKGGHSPRTMSPEASRMRDVSNHSETRSSRSGESPAASARKKKSVRVSFEEKPITLGQSAGDAMSPSDTVMSPQYVKALEAGQSQGFDSETGMGNRPALPSFGSVRSQQRPLEDPSAQQQTSRGGLNPARKVALDESIQSSDTLSGQDSETIGAAIERPQENLLAPQIEVQPATPRVGGRNEEEIDPMGDAGRNPANRSTDPASGDGGVLPTGNTLHEGVADDETPWASTHPKNDNYSDTDDGVDDDDFSDAAEGQTDEVEVPGGFASLDAILESPATERSPPNFPSPQTVSELPADVPAAPQAVNVATADDAVTAADTTQPQDEDWDTVRAYWSGLSEQKKREMEYQANPDVMSGTATTTIPEEEAEQPTPTRAPKQVSKKTAAPQSGERLPPWPDQKYQQSAKTKPKSAMKQPTQQSQPVNPVKTAATLAAKPRQSKPAQDSTHMRKSMRSGGAMRSSMAERPTSMSAAQQPRTPQQNNGKRPASMSTVSPAALALAQQAMPKLAPKPVRRGSNDSSASESSFRKKRRGSDSTAGGGQYSFARSMRGGAGPVPVDNRPMSPPRQTKAKASKRASDPPPTEQKGGFLGFGKSKPTPAKAKGKPKGMSGGRGGGGGGSRFKSRFADSSDEDSDAGGGGGFTSRFKSRFNESDEDSSDDDMPASPRVAPSKLAPVRGIPRKAGKQDGDSTDLEDSDDDATGPRAAVPGPASAKRRPGTPPASTALNFGSKGTAGKEVTPGSSTSPAGPNAVGDPSATNGSPAEGTALGAGTLRTDEDATTKRRSFFHRNTKSKDKNLAPPAALSDSKWAPPATTSPSTAAAAPSSPPAVPRIKAVPPSRPVTPSRMPKSLRANPPAAPVPRSSSRHSLFRRSSSSAPATPSTPNNPGMTKESFPFPPPPIPEKYAGFSKNRLPNAANATDNEGRPNTSDGVSNKGSTLAVPGRPGMGNKRDSAMTAPSTGGRSARAPVYSEKTGRKKKFQGLRRVFGLND